jgi:hypothetical protein
MPPLPLKAGHSAYLTLFERIPETLSKMIDEWHQDQIRLWCASSLTIRTVYSIEYRPCHRKPSTSKHHPAEPFLCL